MDRSHFKNFFERYFNYPYEKLEFKDADCVRKEISASYECQPDEVECFFLFSKMIHYCVKEIMHYGFYRIKGSDFYIPFYAHASATLITSHVALEFNYDINNSVFDCCHIPLKKEKTVEFYYLIIDNLQPAIKKTLDESNLFTIELTLKKSTIYFDFDLTCHTLEVNNRCGNFSEFFSIKHNCQMEARFSIRNKCEMPSVMTNIKINSSYHLNYCFDKRMDSLSLNISHCEFSSIRLFEKAELFKQSFRGIKNFGSLEYTNISELDALVKEYRIVEKMYLI